MPTKQPAVVLTSVALSQSFKNVEDEEHAERDRQQQHEHVRRRFRRDEQRGAGNKHGARERLQQSFDHIPHAIAC